MGEMRGEIVSVGTELLLGQITNTNACFLSRELAQLGIDVFFISSVGDNHERLREVLKTAWNRSDLIIFTGGLGPTLDDITREVVADFLGLELVLHPDVLESLRCFFAARGRTMTENNVKQAMFPASSRILPNPNGTAAGMLIEKEGRIIVLLPGPPFEMETMFHNEVVPLLDQRLTGSRRLIKSRVLKLYGIGESHLESIIYPLLEKQSNPTLAPLAKEMEVQLRLTAKADNEEKAKQLLDEMEGHVRHLVGPYIFAVDEETMEEVVGSLLRRRGMDLALAESCTGGLIGHRLTNVPGSSAYLHSGFIMYSNEAKVKFLQVNQELIAKYGAVSSQVAQAMAEGVRKAAGTSLGLAVTGIAGPEGGSRDKPVGLIYISLAATGASFVEKYNFHGPRRIVKMRASQAALDMLRRFLEGNLTP